MHGVIFMFKFAYINQLNKAMKKRLLNGEHIDLSNKDDLVNLWFQPITRNFCLMLNSRIIKATKTWPPIQKKLDEIGNLTEIN